MHDDRLRRKDPVPFQHLRQEHLVGALQNRLRVVHHDEPLRLRLAGEPVGMMVDAGGLPEEEGIELGDPPEVLSYNFV